ncbi:helix-turn-helix domain-containing protein [Pseudonocardia sp. DSM 110487]|uniref:helix-turn-helix domain-containing protein n=1 Tax=Pseudonocardia sp. DSM 110487 TaxID=2865833 RepID=UPI001C69490D|nr:helix-turn-helix domain-containing protein [Pseudonocardia sp. DSM 110487]QYN37905.1 helix-turn-helix domain-containing protein [Pseudonocardia sp. DSM 110487]
MQVDPTPIFVRDCAVPSGGITASLDLILSFIEEDHGAEIARRVALAMVTYLQRPGSQAQISLFTTIPHSDQVLVRRVIEHVISNLDGDLGVGRLEAASQLLTGTREPVTTIARRCGFGSAESLRQAIVAWVGISPTRFRGNSRASG